LRNVKENAQRGRPKDLAKKGGQVKTNYEQVEFHDYHPVWDNGLEPWAQGGRKGMRAGNGMMGSGLSEKNEGYGNPWGKEITEATELDSRR